MKALSIAPGQTIQMHKAISLAEMTTRTHYLGTHHVDVILNGQIKPLGSFDLLKG